MYQTGKCNKVVEAAVFLLFPRFGRRKALCPVKMYFLGVQKGRKEKPSSGKDKMVSCETEWRRNGALAGASLGKEHPQKRVSRDLRQVVPQAPWKSLVEMHMAACRPLFYYFYFFSSF